MNQHDRREPNVPIAGAPERDNAQDTKASWVEPRLEFVEPKLTEHGGLHRLTGGFFGTFSP